MSVNGHPLYAYKLFRVLSHAEAQSFAEVIVSRRGAEVRRGFCWLGVQR